MLSFTERTLLHWCEEAVRTWDEHDTSATVSSPIGHMISMLSLLLCFHQYNTGWICFVCSSVFTNRTEDEGAISAVVWFLVSNLMHLFIISFHIPLHVSGHIVLIIRRMYIQSIWFFMCHSSCVTVRCTGS